MDTPALADQQKLTFISSVWTLDAIERNCLERRLIGMDGEKELRESMLSACLDNNIDDDTIMGHR